MAESDTEAATAAVPIEGTGRPTLRTIAFMTGLSVTSVSRALKDAPDIGEETKRRVRLVASQVGYRPNRAGVRLRTGRTSVISLILSVESEVFGVTAHLVQGISAHLAGTGYHLIVTPYRPDGDPLDPVRYVVETASADGVIFSRTEPRDARVRYLHERGFPFATHGRTAMGIEHPWFDFDNARYGEIAVERLARRGCRRLALLAPPPSLTFSGHMAAGFQRGLERLGLEEVPLRGVDTDSPEGEIVAAVVRLLGSDRPPDGFVSGSAAAAVSIVVGAEAAGRTIGGGVELAVKESFGIMRKFRPSIEVVHEDFRMAGKTLALHVLERIAGTPAEALQTLQVPEG
jgi:LacI family transcriptional regulator